MDLERFKDKLEAAEKEMKYGIKKIKLNSAQKNIIGGIIAVDKGRGVRIDATLAMKIEESRELIGELLYKEWEKAGEDNGTL